MIYLILFLLLGSYSYSEENKSDPWQEIAGRDMEKTPIYRAPVPKGWLHKETTSAREDTIHPLCTFTIIEGDEKIRITVHNFPTASEKERVPPSAQLERWKRQFSSLNPTSVTVTPQCHGGFKGLYFEANGIFEGEEKALMAWSMQCALEHYRHLQEFTAPPYRQMAADYTIKAVGPKQLMQKHKADICAFASNFELIEEIPLCT